MALRTGRRNGHNQSMDTPFDGSSMSDIERTMSQSEMPNVAQHFVKPGKTYRDMLMRTVFRDANERNTCLVLIRQCEEFDLQEYIDLIDNWLAAAPSVEGRSRKELLQAFTGIVVPSLYSDSKQERGRSDKRNGDEPGR